MSYELFRNEVLLNMAAEEIPVEHLVPAIHAVDEAAKDYDFNRKEIALTVVNGVPQVLKMYIGARATENLSPDTLRTYFYDLRNFFTSTPKHIDEIDANDIRCYLWNYKKTRDISDRTLNQIRICIKSFYTWCLHEKVFPEMVSNPCEPVKSIKYYAKPRQPFTVEELETIRVFCMNERERAIVDLIVSSGIRVSELCALKKEDINMVTREVRVWHGKGDKFRQTYLSAEAMISLRRYYMTRNDNCPYVIVNFRGRDKHKIGKRGIESMLKKICERAGIENPERWIPHNLRHTFATVMIQNGAPVQHVQKLLGHAKLETTMIYAKDNQMDIKRTHERCAV